MTLPYSGCCDKRSFTRKILMQLTPCKLRMSLKMPEKSAFMWKGGDGIFRAWEKICQPEQGKTAPEEENGPTAKMSIKKRGISPGIVEIIH